jgi:hypothetical protein
LIDVRRAVALLLALLFLTVSLTVSLGVVGTASATDSATATGTDPAAGKGVAVDRRLDHRECNLTGRVWTSGGCARHHCVSGSVMFKEGHDAELCRLAGRNGAEYARPINSRRCAQLNRVWIGEINSCASNPNRARRMVEHSARCTGAASTYVNHSEEEGFYDECLTPHRVNQLRRIAKRKKISLNQVAVDRSRFNCSYRGGTVMKDGVCIRRPGPPPAADLGGFLMVGDSVSWRADNELAGRAPGWELDLRPGRRLDELPGRLDWFRSDHGNPDRLIVQLGTNRRQGFNEGDFRVVMASVPSTTPVMFLLPYRKFTGNNKGPVAATKKYAGWMRRLAADRPQTCLADWPTYAANHLANLVDGEHPDARHESWYARYVIHAWGRCAKQLGV